MNKVNYINFSERNVFIIIGYTLIKAKRIIISLNFKTNAI